MATFVSADWVRERLGATGVVVIDPRSAMRYLMGHLQAAVSMPYKKLTDAQGKLLPDSLLAEALGQIGLGDWDTPVIYDGRDGRNAAMLAWVLEYLGRDDVHIMDVTFQRWVDEGGEIFYRPVTADSRKFSARPKPQFRAALADVSANSGAKVVDLRSRDEFDGDEEMDERPGHVPGSLNIEWSELAGDDGQLLCTEDKARGLLEAAGVRPGDPVVALCRSGVRAALGSLAWRRLGYDVRLYPGSYLEYMASGLPVER
ncbi:MAG: sulfurtransferase [Chloroflexi bacterium]|nr:sulfurtransferase [Chloroflexota bacterium]